MRVSCSRINQFPAEKVRIVHDQVWGRVRFRAEAVQHSLERAEELEARLRLTPGIRAASANPLTGSVLVQYDPGIIGIPIITSLIRVISPEPVEPWHHRMAEATAAHFQTPEHGLTVRQAGQRIHQYGPNAVPDIPHRLRFLILREQVLSIPLLMLSAAAVFAFLTGAVVDALFIGGALIANAALGFVTEDRAERAIQSLRRTQTPEAWVLREGVRTAVPVESIVPGNVLLLEPGQIAAADARILRSDHLLKDESLLTGENEARPKSADPMVGGERAGFLWATGSTWSMPAPPWPRAEGPFW